MKISKNQNNILSVLSKSPFPISAPEIDKRIKISESAVRDNLKKLAKEGYVRKIRVKRKQYKWEITGKGMGVVIYPEHMKIDEIGNYLEDMDDIEIIKLIYDDNLEEMLNDNPFISEELNDYIDEADKEIIEGEYYNDIDAWLLDNYNIDSIEEEVDLKPLMNHIGSSAVEKYKKVREYRPDLSVNDLYDRIAE